MWKREAKESMPDLWDMRKTQPTIAAIEERMDPKDK